MLLISKLETHSSFEVKEAQRGHPCYHWVSTVEVIVLYAQQIWIEHVSYDDA